MYVCNENLWGNSPLCKNSDQFFITILLKQIYTLPTAQGLRQVTRLQAGGDQEDRPFGERSCLFQCDTKLLVTEASLPVKLPGQTSDDHITAVNGFADFVRPVLAWKQFLLIQPDICPFFYKVFV